MALSLKPEHLRRYKDMALLLVRYGRADLVRSAGLEEAIEILEDQHSANGSTRFRFSLKDESLIAEVEEREPDAVRGIGTASGWRTVVEMVS